MLRPAPLLRGGDPPASCLRARSCRHAAVVRGASGPHRLSTRQFFYKDGAVPDVDDFGRQLAKSDGKRPYSIRYRLVTSLSMSSAAAWRGATASD